MGTPYFNKLDALGLSSVARSVNYELSTPTKLGIRFIAPWAQKANDIITANWTDVLLGKKPLTSTIQSMVAQINGVIQQGP